jgi:hypothetical protein
MNYINQINGFWEKVNSGPGLRTSSGFIYMALLQRNNKHNWIEEFTVDYEIIMNMTSVSKNTYYECLKELQEKGFIKYQRSGNRALLGKISIIPLYQNLVLDKDTRSNTNLDTKSNSSLDSSSTLNKQINKKQETTKQQTVDVRDVEIDLSFEKEILAYFGFNEVANIDKLRTIVAFTTKQKKSEGLEYFKKQYGNYKKYKQLSGEQKHGFTSFLGQPEKQFEGGKWDEANWELKFLEVSKHGKSNERSNPRVRPVPTAGRSFGKL